MNEAGRLREAYQFETKRRELAKRGDLAALKSMYKPDLPEVPDRNTPDEWDSLSKVPESERLNVLVKDRIKKTTKLVPTYGSILDIGVGWGYVTKELSKEKGDFHYLGIDFSPLFIKGLKTSISDSRFEFRVVENIDNLDNLFDTVMALEVLEHIKPSLIFRFLKSVKNRLRPGGYFIVSVPIFENISDLAEIKGSKVFTPSRHVRSYSPDLILTELKLAGFHIEKYKFVYGIDFSYFIKGIAKRILGRDNYAYNILIRARK